MNVEVWQRGTDAAHAMIGVAKLPMHQFHIAFYDINVRLHVSKQKVRRRLIQFEERRRKMVSRFL